MRREQRQKAAAKSEPIAILSLRRSILVGKSTCRQENGKSALAMANLGTHTSFFSSQFPTPFTCFLNSHFPALSKKIVAKFQRKKLSEATSESLNRPITSRQ